MKKILIATSALVATAGVAAADVTLSGYGRFGLDHSSAVVAPGVTKTRINSRFRLNIDGSAETDAGVTFGARVRMQQSSGGVTVLNQPQFSATYQGLRMEVGNANSAIDSVALMYNSEIGYLDRGLGDPIGGFAAYSSGVASLTRQGVFASYKLGADSVRASVINLDQTATSSIANRKEVSVSADYKFGQFTVAAAYADNAANVNNATSAFIGAEYAITPDANAGLLHFQDKDGAGVKVRRTTVYGNYKMDAMTFKGYVANDNDADNLTDTAFGLGMDYDLGGARLAGDIHRTYAKTTVVGLGVRFNF